MTMVGAAGGAIVGSVVTESTLGVDAKRIMLSEALDVHAASQQLAERVRLKAISTFPPESSLASDRSPGTPPGWTLRIALTQFATEGSGPDVPYKLQATATLELISGTGEKPVFIKEYQAQSDMKMTTREWRTDNGGPVCDTLDALLEMLATSIMADVATMQDIRYLAKRGQ